MNVIYLFIGIPSLIILICLILLAMPRTMEKMMEENIKTVKNIVDNNEDILKEMSTKSANISSEGVEVTAKAIKKGFSEDENRDSKYCKYCGKEIDLDSKFCNYCGKEQ